MKSASLYPAETRGRDDAETLLADPAFPLLKKYLVKSTGLVYYTGKDADFACRAGRRLLATGSRDCVSYLDLLADPMRGPSERDALIAEVTIGETYFFRHREHFDALREVVFPNLLERRRDTRQLRIWSAGCSDGPEVYSLAILIRRQLAAQFAGWQVTILGTDINRRALARAREGEFEAWSFRAESPDLRDSCFTRAGERWRIAPEFRNGIEFQYHNLVEDGLPAGKNPGSFDLIVCRNVMIYFGLEIMSRVAAQFQERLSPGGWLLVGPTEPNMTSFQSFQAVNAPGVTLYQKHDAGSGSPSGWGRLPAPPQVNGFSGPSAPIPSVPEPPQQPPTLADVRRHADQGAWEDAARACEQLLQSDNLNSAVHFYYALVLEHMHRQEDAERSLRRAIYLDRESILAHYYLGLLLRSRMDVRPASRAFENAIDLLRRRDGAEVFPDAGGISAAELARLAEIHLNILRSGK